MIEHPRQGTDASIDVEIAGEELESMPGKGRIICNLQLDPDDVKSARAAAMATPVTPTCLASRP